jgi:TatD DNase family protein
MTYYDAHCHLHEYSDNDIKDFLDNDLVIVGVSDDLESTVRTLKLREKFGEKVIPCVGIHPWNATKTVERDVERVIELAERFDVKCLGEIGLDLVFVPESLDKQIKIFVEFLEYVKGRDLVLNIHSPGAWSRVLQLLNRYDVAKALFHWFTGPQEVLKEIRSHDYMISINPSVKIQNKHLEIARKIDIEGFVIESDGPYNYKGLQLSPKMIFSTIKFLSEIKNMSLEELIKNIEINFKKLFIS